MTSYPGEMTDENIRRIFRDANDFIRRPLLCCGRKLYAYAIDGLIAAAYATDYVIKPIAEQLQAEVREQYDEPAATVQAFDVDALGGNSLSTESTAKIISLLCAAPNGIQSWSKDIEGLVQTSLNLGVIKLGDRFNASFSVRSSVESEKTELIEQLKKLADMFDSSCTVSGEYPAWEYRKESSLRDTMVAVYKDMFGKTPDILAIHAGLECGLFSQKVEDLDCISIGPQMHDIHTSNERLEIASTLRTWNFLKAVLAAL